MAKRTYSKLRKKILHTLSKDRTTINTISKKTGINWRTVESHLVYLTGRGLVNEAHSSEYARIYELTPEGKEYMKYMEDEFDEKIVKLVKNDNTIKSNGVFV